MKATPTTFPKPILPGSAVGIFGSGQLGRMLALVAKRLGYRVAVFSPDTDSPAGSVADTEVVADYNDLAAVADFAKKVDVVTLEFENVPVTALEAAAIYAPVRPGWQVLYTAQNRLREKTFLAKAGFPAAAFRPIRRAEDIGPALRELGVPAVLKTAGFGYDGKGQRVARTLAEAEEAFADLQEECILEPFVAFVSEVSVVGVRGTDGTFTHYAVAENRHAHHILDVSVAPAGVSREVAAEAVRLTRDVMNALEVVGVLCVEFFVTREDRVLVNELAPRPHNSGHLTMEACPVGQFEAQLRAVCGLPLVSQPQRPAAMVNLLGDLWEDGEPDWAAALTEPAVTLHLYGKAEPRAGRKMGHLTALADTVEEAASLAQNARRRLKTRSETR